MKKWKNTQKYGKKMKTLDYQKEIFKRMFKKFNRSVCGLLHNQPAAFFGCRTQNTAVRQARWKMMIKGRSAFSLN